MASEKQIAKFAAWLEDRRVTHLASSADLMIEVAELDAVREAFYRIALDGLSPVQRALVLAGRNMYRNPTSGEQVAA